MTLPQKTMARNLWFLQKKNTAEIARFLNVSESELWNDRSWQTMGEIRK